MRVASLAGIAAAALCVGTAALAAQSGGTPEAAARPTAPAAEIAAAAAACVAAVGDKGVDSAAMGRAGWPLAETTGEVRIHARDGSNVRAMTTGMGGGQCIVDAYGGEGFEAIRDVVRTGLKARFGSAVKLGTSVGSEGSFSQGQGFRIGKRIAVLSSERRGDGLSIRFVVMRLP